MNPSRSGPHSKKLWICKSEVGPWNESLANSIYSDASSPRPTLRSQAEALTLSTAETSQEGKVSGENFWRRSSRAPSRESISAWGSDLCRWPWVKSCGPPRLRVDGSIQTRGAGFWWALRVSLKGGLWSRTWGSARLLISRWSSSGGTHRTSWCEFKDLQAACSPDRCWGSNSMEQFR